MNDKLKLIRERCIAANPEIVELKFGCRFEMIDPEEDKSVWVVLQEEHNLIPVPASNDTYDNLTVVGREEGTHGLQDGLFTEEIIRSLWKIVGRPIRLADVLLALPNQHQRKVMEGYFSGDRINPYEALILNTISLWNLRIDDLEKNSQTWDFLYELLK